MPNPVILSDYRTPPKKPTRRPVLDAHLRAIVEGRSTRAGFVDQSLLTDMAAELLERRTAEKSTAADRLRDDVHQAIVEAFFRNFRVTGFAREHWRVDTITALLIDELQARYGPLIRVSHIHAALHRLAQDPTRDVWLGSQHGMPLVFGIRVVGAPA